MSDRTPDDAHLGLRERRRRDMLRELSDAAIDLFEQHGVHATTVDDIARVVGISQRTFFRYYPTKENAVFLADERSDAIMREAAEQIREGSPVMPTLERGWLRIFEEFDDRAEDHGRTLRVRRLVQAEPTILALALSHDAERTDEFVAAAADADASGGDLLVARAVVSIIGTTARIAFDEWARRAEQGVDARVGAIYGELRAGIALHAAALATGEVAESGQPEG